MSFKTDGLDTLIAALDDLVNIPDFEIFKMTEAGAEVVAKEIKATGNAMGVKQTGVMLDSIKVTKTNRSGDAVKSDISPTGTRKNGNTTKRNAEIAYINNYGKKGQQARPFFSDGIAKAENEALSAAEQQYDKYLKEKNL